MSTTTRWSEVAAVFEAALQYSGTAREKFLDGSCRGDDDFRERVKSLLDADNNASGFLSESPAGRLAPLFRIGSIAPTVIGPYKVERLIGRGGMGAVYRAERRHDYQRVVAIKILDRIAPTRRSVLRFRRERDILSRLEHPNIARLYDGGIDDQVGLYLVMEFVDGLPIVNYCEKNELAVRQRLELFLAVCDAVSFAHRNLVVHRDLKPSNILVTSGGTVKLLDFGIAKWLDQEELGDLSTTSAPVMTPAYASPEQIQGGPVTTQSDIYSLGVVLFEMLTGVRPYETSGATPRGGANVVFNSIPMNPSDSVSFDEGNGAAYSRLLRGDVDRIVLKSLQVSLDRRYASVDGFATDVSLHLEGRPIKAKENRRGYVARKFISRNRKVVISTMIGAVLFLGASAVSVGSWNRYRAERAVAKGLTSYLADLFEVADPSLRSDTSITAREILEIGRIKASQRLSRSDPYFAEVMLLVGQLYTKIGGFQAAEEVHRSALEGLGSRMPGLRSDNLLGLANAQRELGRYMEAQANLEIALSERYKASGKNHLKVADIHFAAMSVASDLGDFARAESLATEVLKMREKLLPAGDLEIANILAQQGILLRRANKLVESEMHHNRALEIYEAQDPVASLEKASVLNSLGMLYTQENDFEKAEQAFSESLRIKRDRLGESHPSFAITLLNVVPALEQTAGPDSADVVARLALELLERSHGINHPDVSRAFNNLALLHRKRGEFAEAESLYYKSLGISEKTLPLTHPSTSIIQHNLAVVLRIQGKPNSAAEFYRRAAKGYRLAQPLMDLERSSAFNGLGKVQRDLGLLDESIESFRECLKIREQILEPGHWRLGTAHSLLGESLGIAGHDEEAEVHLIEGLEILERANGSDNVKTKEARERLQDFQENARDHSRDQPAQAGNVN